jgi:hypothetical protein
VSTRFFVFSISPRGFVVICCVCVRLSTQISVVYLSEFAMTLSSMSYGQASTDDIWLQGPSSSSSSLLLSPLTPLSPTDEYRWVDYDGDEASSSSPITHQVIVKRELTDSPAFSDSPNRLHALLPPLTNHSRLSSHSTISTPQNNTFINSSQDVRLPALNSVASRPSITSSNNHPTPVGNLLYNNVSINNNNNSLRTTPSSVINTTKDLAAQHGIPTKLPPLPRLTPRSSQPPRKPQPQQEASIFSDFDALTSNYLKMLATKPEETTSPSMPVAMQSTPAINTATQVLDDLGLPAVDAGGDMQNLIDTILGDYPLVDPPLPGANTFYLPVVTASPEFRDIASFDASPADMASFSPATTYSASPYMDTPALDFTSPFTSPLDNSPMSEFLSTPQMNDMPEFGAPFDFSGAGWDMGVGGNVDAYGLFTTGVVAEKVHEVAPASTMFSVSPQVPSTSSFDPNVFTAPAPAPVAETPAIPAVAEEKKTVEKKSVSSPSPAPAAKGRRANATGTRKNITPDNLLGMEAPTQSRKYTTPSATSRKELPAIFARKRIHSEAFEGVDDEDELAALPPNATEKEQIEWKRRQNTLAARKSRKRKLAHQQELETKVEFLTAEMGKWKTRTEMLLSILRSHGHPLPAFDDADD